MTRTSFNWIGGVAATLVGWWSLYEALHIKSKFIFSDHTALGKFLVGLWVLAPPIFFWIDWVYFCRGLSSDEREVAKHTHDLSRNIWLALVAVLAVLFGVKTSAE